MEKTNHVTSHSHTARCLQAGILLDTALRDEMFRLRSDMLCSTVFGAVRVMSPRVEDVDPTMRNEVDPVFWTSS